MQLTDLFAQNVRGLGPQLRASLGPGATELTPAPPHLLQLLRTLFYASGFDPDANFAERPSEPARAGFMLTHEGQTYRLLRDLGTGAVQLAVKTTELQPVATTAADVLQRLRAMGLPSAEAFAAIFALSSNDFPSRQSSGGKPRASIETELAALRARPRKARSTDAIEFEIDGLQKQKYGWEDLSKRRQKISAEVEQWQDRLLAGAWIDALPADLPKRVSDFEHAGKKRASELAELGEDDPEPPLPPRPLRKNWQLWLGVVLGAVCFGLGAALNGQARFVGLLDVAAFGWAAILGLQFVSESEAHERFTHRLGRRQDVRRRIEEKFTSDTQYVREVLAKANGASSKDLIEQQGQRGYWRELSTAAEAKLHAFDVGEGAPVRSWEAERIDARISELEEQLALAGDAPADTTLAEIAALERELAVSTGAASGPFTAHKLILALAECSGGQAVPLAERAAQFASQWWGRAVAIAVDERGFISCDESPFAQLVPEAQDQIWLALRLAAFELCPQPAPLWLCDLAALPHLQTEWLTTYVPFVSQKAQTFVCGAAPFLGLPHVSLI